MSQNLGNIVPVRTSVYVNGTKAAATGTLTSNNTNVTNNKVVVIGGTTYTFKTTLTGAANEVLIGADADATLTNLRTLINSGRAAVAASGVLTSDTTNPADADEVVIGAKTYVFKTALTEAKSTGTLTATGQPTAGQTVTIDGVVYTFRASLADYVYGNTPYQILIGADYDTTLGNLVAAINGDAGEGTKYSFNTPVHPTVTAGAVGAHATVITAKTVGTAGDSIATTETASNMSFGAATLGSGADAVVNEVLIGADTDATLTNLKAAVNGEAGEGTNYSTGTVASTEMTCSAVDTNAVTLTAITAGTAGNSLAKTENSAHLDWDGAGAVMTGGVTATPANTQVTCGAVAAHAVLITASTTGFAGNSIVSTTDEVTLSWTAAALAGGGGTVGTYEIVKGGGMARRFLATIPQYTGTPTVAIAIYDSSDTLIKTLQATAAENALSDTAYEVMLAEGDYIKFTTTTAVEDTTLPIVLEIR